MATGMQTGMRTGSAPLPTGTRPGGGPMGGTPVAKVLGFINGLSPKQKLIGGIVIGVLILAIVGGSMYSKSAAFVPLYDTKLSPTDVKQITMKLTEMGIDYSVAEGGVSILISPGIRNKARMQLASYGLPLRPLRTPEEGGMTPKTTDDKKYERLQLLEADMTESIRQVDGIADAYVKIVQPEKDYFGDEAKKPTAAVMVRLQPGAKLTKSQIKGMVHLIAFSVEGLEPKNVEVVDTKGFRLTDETLFPDEGTPEFSSQQMDKKVAFERQLQQKVQGLLDDVLGPNKSRVAVNATLDFSSSETETFKVGGPSNTTGVVKEKEKIGSEFFTSGPNGGGGDEGGTQMSFKGSKGSSDNSAYKKYDKTVVYKTDQIKKRTVTPPGRVERITASVMVDNLKPDQVTKIGQVVKDAIGIDETRGDSVTVASLPFNSNQLDAMRESLMAGPVAKNRSNTPINSSYLFYVSGAAMAILLIPLMIFMLRQRKVQTVRSRIIMEPGPGATASDISDLISDKIGRSTAPPETQVNTTDQLEKLAKEKPTKVAELLKSTWLAEKER